METSDDVSIYMSLSEETSMVSWLFVVSILRTVPLTFVADEAEVSRVISVIASSYTVTDIVSPILIVEISISAVPL